jgi:uncharacterized protein (DUF58 family)
MDILDLVVRFVLVIVLAFLLLIVLFFFSKQRRQLEKKLQKDSIRSEQVSQEIRLVNKRLDEELADLKLHRDVLTETLFTIGRKGEFHSRVYDEIEETVKEVEIRIGEDTVSIFFEGEETFKAYF